METKNFKFELNDLVVRKNKKDLVYRITDIVYSKRDECWYVTYVPYDRTLVLFIPDMVCTTEVFNSEFELLVS